MKFLTALVLFSLFSVAEAADNTVTVEGKIAHLTVAARPLMSLSVSLEDAPKLCGNDSATASLNASAGSELTNVNVYLSFLDVLLAAKLNDRPVYLVSERDGNVCKLVYVTLR